MRRSFLLSWWVLVDGVTRAADLTLSVALPSGRSELALADSENAAFAVHRFCLSIEETFHCNAPTIHALIGAVKGIQRDRGIDPRTLRWPQRSLGTAHSAELARPSIDSYS
jgi:hypothetical protein